jgi:hypothetical protein
VSSCPVAPGFSRRSGRTQPEEAAHGSRAAVGPRAGEQCNEPDEPRGYRLKEWRASGEPVLAEVGAPFMLSLGVAGYRSVRRTHVIQQPARIRPAMTTASPVTVFAG